MRKLQLVDGVDCIRYTGMATDAVQIHIQLPSIHNHSDYNDRQTDSHTHTHTNTHTQTHTHTHTHTQTLTHTQRDTHTHKHSHTHRETHTHTHTHTVTQKCIGRDIFFFTLLIEKLEVAILLCYQVTEESQGILHGAAQHITLVVLK